jgi:eukaryotic-like serine/threonine-protein kinase
MNTQRWESVKDLLHQALQLAPEQRDPFLDQACSSDVAMRAELESLLSAEQNVRSSFMQSPPLADKGMGVSVDVMETAGGLKPGQVFAQRFRLVRKLGEGGMGQVWLADQTSPVQRQVALKLIKAGMYDEAVVQRFQSEQQSLAIMDHPAIAKVFDAGSTPQGQPYFVMEYVPGVPITEYCDQKKLNILQRLELFLQACDGVQHAHQKAIIHRDLKPGNLLVVEVNSKPEPRIIDFGLAKAIAPKVEAASLFTQIGNLVGTPGYMSPEQADPNVGDIDTRTDVYSLGVVLYVLLTGLQPFDTKQKQPLDELLRKLREEEAPSPSTKVGADRETSVPIAEARGTEPKPLVKVLRGDLDSITMKAIEKDRARRYGTPSELAADIRRYLNHEPVLARPASAVYRLGKYVRRHRVAVGIAAGLVLLLAGFIGVQSAELRKITRERDRANRERDRATRITDFMTSMFRVSDPSEARGNSVTAREILDKASNDMGTGLVKDPEVQTQMLEVMAGTYSNLGLYVRAQELAQRALDTRRNLLGPVDPMTLASMTQLGWILDREGHYEEAEKLERQALEEERRILGQQDPQTIESIDYLAVILEDKAQNAEAEKLAREAVQASTRRLGPENSQTLLAINHLARALWYQARYDEAEQQYRYLADVDRRVLGPDHPQTLKALSSLGATLYAEHRFTESEQVDRQVVAVERRVFGSDHQATVLSISNLAACVHAEGHMAEAEKLNREVFAIRLRTLGPEHDETLTTETNLADVLMDEGHLRESEKLQREALAIQMRVLGPEHRDTLWAKSNLAGILMREGRYTEAERLAREAYDAQVRTLGPQHDQTVDTMRNLGEVLAYEHRYDEATKLFRDAIQQEDRSGKLGNPWQNWYAFACVATAANHADDALQYLREAVNRGYQDGDGLMAEDDLKKLRTNPKFQQLVTTLKRPAPAQTR